MKLKPLLILLCLSLLLTGCLYPDRESKTVKTVSKEAIRNVQAAVSEYLDDKSIYPVTATNKSQFKNLNLRIDFQKLMNENYIETIPSSAFEKSGIFYYVIYEYDDLPLVKAFDLTVSQTLVAYQDIVFDYILSEYTLPAGEEVAEGFYKLDYEILKSKEQSFISPFTGQQLEFMVSTTGEVYVNYMADIMNYVQQYGNVESYSDLNEILIVNSDYIPIKSPKYKFENNMPIPYE